MVCVCAHLMYVPLIQFCGPCLKNRYGEDITEKLLDPVRTGYHGNVNE